YRSIQGQAAIEQLPLGTQLPGLVLFRIQVLGVGGQPRTGGSKVLRRWVVGIAPGQINVPVLDRFVDQAERSEEHTSELQSREKLVCRLLAEIKKLVTRKRTLQI